jgi:hypothetical protein
LLREPICTENLAAANVLRLLRLIHDLVAHRSTPGGLSAIDSANRLERSTI